MHLWLTIVLVVVIGAGIVLVVAVAGSRSGHHRGSTGLGDEVLRPAAPRGTTRRLP
jgi:hypothetical protein